jgi:DNA polymerase I
LEIILKENDVKKAVEYVKEIVKKTKEGKIPIKKMIIKKRLIKEIEDYVAIGPHVNVAKKLVKRGETVGAGSDILYVVQPGKGNIGARALPSDEAKIYDPEYYINHQIIPVVERILSAVGYEKEDVTNEQKQKSLGDF